MANILVAVAFNLVATLILISGIFSSLRNGVRVSLVKFGLTLGAGVGCYFLTPFLVGKLLPIAVEGTTLGNILTNGLGISVGTISSVIFTLCFLIFYAFNLCICNIVRHILVKSLRNKAINKAKMTRAKSINAKAEKAARKSEWKALNFKFRSGKKWYHRLISLFIGSVVAIIVGFVMLLPGKYIGNDLTSTNIVKEGYKYTLNGIICDKIEGFDFGDWLLQLNDDEKEPEQTPEECEHSFIEGVCEKCGDPEVIPGE